MTTAVELLASCWTHAGDAAPQRGDELSPFSLRSRVEAVAHAGWKGIGLLHADLMRTHAMNGGWQELASLIRLNGLEYLEVEFLGGWWAEGVERTASDTVRRELLDAAAALGARTVKVAGDMTGATIERSRLVDSFGALADEAASAGTRIALEALPFSNFSTIEQGAEFVAEVAHPHGGLIVDIWHVFRGGSTLASIAKALDPRYLFAVELNDAAAAMPDDLWLDTINERRLPGEGDWDVPGFIRTLRDVGFAGPWGVEILSNEHRAKSLDDEVESAFAAAMSQFALAD